MDALTDLEFLMHAPSDADPLALYDRAADRYDHFRNLWLRAAGSGAEAAMLADARAALKPESRILDAGCGTGAIARDLHAVEPTAHLTLLDLSEKMLERTRDLPAERVIGSVQALPFADQSFDLVVSAWVIETVPDPKAAVSEFLRVLHPEGRALYTFCSLPGGWFSRAGSGWLRRAVGANFAGDFLPAERTPWHDCGKSHRARFSHGLTTEIALAACCSVGPLALPA